MKFSVLKDIKIGEFRVIATPVEVGMLVRDGHEVYVSAGAGSIKISGNEAGYKNYCFFQLSA